MTLLKQRPTCNVIARIIPLKRLPRRLSVFDYVVPEPWTSEIRLGQLVEIPFRSSNIFGVVFEIKDGLEEKLKEIADVVIKEPLVSKTYLEWIVHVADVYGLSAATVLKMGLMPVHKRKLRAIKTLTDIPEQKPSEKRINVRLYNTNTEHQEKLRGSIKGKTLIFIPELFETNFIYEFLYNLHASSSKKIVVWNSNLSPKQQFERWFQIRNGEFDVIIATRGAVLLPFPNLETVIVDYEHDENHKNWDQAPRLHVKDVVPDIARTHAANIVYMSYSLSLDSYYRIQKGLIDFEGKRFDTSAVLFTRQQNQATVVERTLEQGSKHYSALAVPLQEKIAQTVKEGQDVFIFVNRKEDAFPHAPVSEEFKSYKINTATVEKELKLFIAHTEGEVVRIEKDLEHANNGKRTQKKIPRIIVGTQAAFPSIHWEKTKLIIYLDIDRQLGLSEFSASEQVWHLIQKSIHAKQADAELIIQTRIPDHVVFRSLGEPDRFYRTELSQRRQPQYPPYSYLARYYCLRSDGKEHEYETVRENIRIALTTMPFSCTLTSLFELGSPAMPNAARGFAIKFETFNTDVLKHINALIPDTWKIDPNPLTLTGL